MTADRSKWNITKPQTIRIDPKMWDELDDACKAAGYDNRTSLLRAFVRWYLRKPGAALPARPSDD